MINWTKCAYCRDAPIDEAIRPYCSVRCITASVRYRIVAWCLIAIGLAVFWSTLLTLII